MSDSNTKHNSHPAAHELDERKHVKLIVGRGRCRELEVISVHPDVLMKSSAIFKARGTSESLHEIRLLDDDYFIIRKYVHWLYSNKFDRMFDYMKSYPSIVAASWELGQLRELHSFATKIKDEEFQRDISTALLATWYQRRSMESNF